MVRTYGTGSSFDIASADSMGIKPMSVTPGRPGGPGDDDDRGRPIIDPIRDDEVPPQDETEETKPTPEEEGQGIADGIGFEGSEGLGSILDDYSFLGFVALAAIGITLFG